MCMWCHESLPVTPEDNVHRPDDEYLEPGPHHTSLKSGWRPEHIDGRQALGWVLDSQAWGGQRTLAYV